jgi:16S rRNA (adenine1518-N6/adenine1519-N6)-dimethyltransferase
VRSTILKIDLRSEPMVAADEVPVLRGLVRAAFGRRRKTLENNLGAWLKIERSAVDRLLRSQQIDPRRRGETLTVDEFIRLARALKEVEPSADH